MKLLLISLFALLTFAAAAQVQRRPGDSTPMKGQNTIIVTLHDTTTFEHIAGTLLDAGYAIVALDRQLGFVTTAPTPCDKSSKTMIVVSARKKGHRAIFSATLHFPAGAAGEKVVFTNSLGNPHYASFEALHRLAYAHGGRIDYETR